MQAEHSSANTKYTVWKDVLWIFLLSRSLIILATFIAISNIRTVKRPSLHCLRDFSDCLTAWWNWDVSAFIDIAHYGYQYKLELTAFFPLWPLTTHLLAAPFGGSRDTIYVSGLILANAFFFLALVLCHRLITSDFGLQVSKNTLLFLALGPFAIFFFVGYSESLFLLLCLATLLFLRHNPGGYRWWLAGLCSLLASLTRSTGIVLLVPYLVTLIQYFWPHRKHLLAHWRSLLNATLPAALIPTGVIIYMLYLNITFGDPFLFSTKQVEVWHRSLHFPWEGTIATIQNIITGFGDFDHNVVDLLFTLLPLTALIIGWRRLPLAYSLLALAMVLFSLSYPYIPEFPLGSSPRYMQIIFPIFLLFGIWSKEPSRKTVFSAVSCVMFALTTLLFVLGISIA